MFTRMNSNQASMNPQNLKKHNFNPSPVRVKTPVIQPVKQSLSKTEAKTKGSKARDYRSSTSQEPKLQSKSPNRNPKIATKDQLDPKSARAKYGMSSHVQSSVGRQSNDFLQTYYSQRPVSDLSKSPSKGVNHRANASQSQIHTPEKEPVGTSSLNKLKQILGSKEQATKPAMNKDLPTTPQAEAQMAASGQKSKTLSKFLTAQNAGVEREGEKSKGVSTRGQGDQQQMRSSLLLERQLTSVKKSVSPVPKETYSQTMTSLVGVRKQQNFTQV